MNGPDEKDIQETERASETRSADAPLMNNETLSAADAQFEAALSRAMRRVETRAELSAKLLALADEAHAQHRAKGGGLRLLRLSNGGRVLMLPQQRSWLGGAIAAVLALGVFVGSHSYQKHERRVEAQRQFETAERITDQTLEHTREQLRAAGITLGQ